VDNSILINLYSSILGGPLALYSIFLLASVLGSSGKGRGDGLMGNLLTIVSKNKFISILFSILLFFFYLQLQNS
tara:strand:+ start:208 stop:429 length:222 start_codon:yes stop_codon:yes gene_type:complete